MSTKLTNAKRYAATAVAVADRASVAWSVWLATNAAIVWGSQMLFSAPAMAPANDNGAPAPVAASALVEPVTVVPLAAKPAAPPFALSPTILPLPSSEASQAVWAYLCGHDAALSDAAREPCPATAVPALVAPSNTDSFDNPTPRSDPFAWSERLNAANDSHHIVQED